MRLADAWIHGIRRFGGDRPHRLRIDTKLVCLIGANEAGKSTALDALSMARHGGAVEPQDRSRRQQVPDDRDAVRLKLSTGWTPMMLKRSLQSRPTKTFRRFAGSRSSIGPTVLATQRSSRIFAGPVLLAGLSSID